MKNKKLLFPIFFIACVISFVATGCATTGNTEDPGSEITTGEVSTEPNALERQGLAFSRIICSPLNMVGFTAAECKNIGGASVILFPFICCWTIPAGAIAMTGDVAAGTFEMLFWQQFKKVRYPWDSFDYEAAKPYCDFTKKLLIVGLTAAAEGAAQGAVDSISGKSSSYSRSYSRSSYSSSRSKTRSRVKHSSCHGTGTCNICKGKGYLGNDPDNTRLRCRGCGGSGSCRPCGGSGFAN